MTAPSEALLKAAQAAVAGDDERGWKSFVRRYRAEMTTPENRPLLDTLASSTRTTNRSPRTRARRSTRTAIQSRWSRRPPRGSLPVTPEFKGNPTARYEFAFSDFDSYLQGALVYVGDRKSDLRTEARDIIGELDACTTVDFATGFGKNGWNVELYVANLFDEVGEIDRFAQCGELVCGQQTYALITPPRTWGLRFSQEF